MTKFFIYLEQIIKGANFFTDKQIKKEIQNEIINDKDNDKKKAIGENLEKLKQKKIDSGEIYVFNSTNGELSFHFKIDNLTYELLLVPGFSNNDSKVENKVRSSAKVDPETFGRLSVVFHPLGLGPKKYSNIKLKQSDSTKLFSYLRTCGESRFVKNKKFYFDGAYTDKEIEILDKLEIFKTYIINNKPNEILQKIKNFIQNKNEQNITNEVYDFFLESFKYSKLNSDLNQNILNEIKNMINIDNLKNLDQLTDNIIFYIRDKLRLNINVREKYFMRLLKKEGITPREGKLYNRSIFFEL
jgi:hypothetical protein